MTYFVFSAKCEMLRFYCLKLFMTGFLNCHQFKITFKNAGPRRLRNIKRLNYLFFYFVRLYKNILFGFKIQNNDDLTTLLNSIKKKKRKIIINSPPLIMFYLANRVDCVPSRFV